jgi:hypothetical protein
MGIMGGIEWERQDGVVKITLMIRRMGLPFHTQMQTSLALFQERAASLRGFSVGIEGSQILIGYTYNPRLGEDFDLKTIA